MQVKHLNSRNTPLPLFRRWSHLNREKITFLGIRIGNMYKALQSISSRRYTVNTIDQGTINLYDRILKGNFMQLHLFVIGYKISIYIYAFSGKRNCIMSRPRCLLVAGSSATDNNKRFLHANKWRCIFSLVGDGNPWAIQESHSNIYSCQQSGH